MPYYEFWETEISRGRRERQEKTRKVKMLNRGKNVRPPLKWWNMMMGHIKKEYPDHSKAERAQIIGGIWQNYSIKSKINVIKKFQIP